MTEASSPWPNLRPDGWRVMLNGIGILVTGGLLWLLGVDLLHAFVLAAVLRRSWGCDARPQ